MRFLIDTNLPPALALWLRAAGQDADHAALLISAHADDRQIWSLAAAQGAIVVTKDADFLDLATRTPTARVVMIRSGNMKLRQFQPWITARLPAIIGLLELGERIVEVQ